MHVPKKMALQRLWSDEMALKRTTQKEMALQLFTKISYSKIVAATATTTGGVATRARRAGLAAGARIIAKIARATVLRTASSAASRAGPTSTGPARRGGTLNRVTSDRIGVDTGQPWVPAQARIRRGLANAREV